ncbi:hypothetical protein N657DRAFT_361274 [Parathielavia appendiculata]|uniref:Uncharacterized protein n=1 Tax=Parathielavia appendiculata TaxID=2587402 RepID=A0AAN6U3F3_9PEZI|nr:hypothetical protein N657DRAFT_361274 [Parathielavia appendiculata]
MHYRPGFQPSPRGRRRSSRGRNQDGCRGRMHLGIELTAWQSPVPQRYSGDCGRYRELASISKRHLSRSTELTQRPGQRMADRDWRTPFIACMCSPNLDLRHQQTDPDYLGDGRHEIVGQQHHHAWDTTWACMSRLPALAANLYTATLSSSCFALH